MRDIPPGEWQWMPHPMHFICSQECRFRMGTVVGRVVVSTVGEYYPDAEVRKILKLKDGEFGEIGFDRKYETMVFEKTKGFKECEVCPEISGLEIDASVYNDAKAAMDGHLEMCRRWAKAKQQKGLNDD